MSKQKAGRPGRAETPIYNEAVKLKLKFKSKLMVELNFKSTATSYEN